MSKEKQIEEMAKDIHKADIAFLAKCIEDVENALNEDFVDKIITRQEFIAKYLYTAGYRKQSAVIDEFARYMKEHLDDTYSTGEDALIDICDLIDHIAQKMKGGAE